MPSRYGLRVETDVGIGRASDDETVVLVLKAKPLFLFMHMIFQKMVKFPPKEPVPGHEDYRPPANL